MEENKKMSEHIYVGSGLRVERDGREPYYRVQVDLTKIKTDAMQHTRKIEFRDGEHIMVNLILSPMKPENCDKYKDHSLKVDTWKPDPNYRKPVAEPKPEPQRQDEGLADVQDDIPW
jgi:hypothetical protein